MKMDIEKMAIKVTEKVLDELLYEGKTLREWIDLIIKFEKDKNKILRYCWECKNRQTYKCTICKNNSQFEEAKEDEKFICDKCIKDDVCIMSDEYESKETCSSFVPKLKDERFICNTCRNKYSCIHYEYAKSFIEENPNNDMKCERYIKE